MQLYNAYTTLQTNFFCNFSINFKLYPKLQRQDVSLNRPKRPMQCTLALFGNADLPFS